MDVLDLLRRPEGKTLEFKRDLSAADGFLRTVVAFANTAGGVVLIGVEDRTRHVRGVKDPFALEERIASLITDSIAPRLLPGLRDPKPPTNMSQYSMRRSARGIARRSAGSRE